MPTSIEHATSFILHTDEYIPDVKLSQCFRIEKIGGYGLKNMGSKLPCYKIGNVNIYRKELLTDCFITKYNDTK